MPEQLERYLNQIGEQIRWKRARPILLRELEDHALEQLDCCLNSGLSEDAATAETMRQLGNPVEIGQELDRLHQPKPQWGLLLMTGLLVLAGTILQIVLLHNTGEIDLEKLILFAILGFGALSAGYFAHPAQLVRHSHQIYWCAIVLTLVLIWLSPCINNIPYYAHVVTMLHPVVFALLLCRLRGRGWRGLGCAVLSLFPLAVTILLIPRLLDLMVLLISGGSLLLIAAWQDWFNIGRGKGLAAIGGVLVTGAGAFIRIGNGFLTTRLHEVLHPEQDPMCTGYMAMAIRSALEGAQPWGRGEMSGAWAGLNAVPEGANDAFLVTIVHALGWVPFFLLIGGLSVLLVWTWWKVLRQRNSGAQFLALAVLSIFTVHTLMSVLLTCGYVLFSVFCPFLKMSTETVLDMGLMGVLLSVLRNETLPFDDATQKPWTPRGKWKLVYMPFED